MGNGEWGMGKMILLPTPHSPLPTSVFRGIVALPGADAEFGVFRGLDSDAAEFAVVGLIGGVVTKQVLRLELGRDLAEDLGQVFELVGEERLPAGLVGQRDHSVVPF